MKRVITLIGIITISACASVKFLDPIQEDVDRGKSKYADVTLEQLAKGKKLYQEQCGTCHKLEKLNSESEEHWKKIVPGMVKKVNKKYGNILSAADEDAILKYVLIMRDAKR